MKEGKERNTNKPSSFFVCLTASVSPDTHCLWMFPNRGSPPTSEHQYQQEQQQQHLDDLSFTDFFFADSVDPTSIPAVGEESIFIHPPPTSYEPSLSSSQQQQQQQHSQQNQQPPQPQQGIREAMPMNQSQEQHQLSGGQFVQSDRVMYQQSGGQQHSGFNNNMMTSVFVSLHSISIHVHILSRRYMWCVRTACHVRVYSALFYLL